MPELPDVVVYVERLNAFVAGRALQRVRVASPFVLRSVDPPLSAADGRFVEQVSRLGKRIVMSLDGDLHLVIHLMIAGRLRWKKPGAAVPKGNGLAAFDFDNGAIVFTEASKKKRASLHLVQGRDAIEAFDRGGLEVLEASFEAFLVALNKENHTLKRALTDPRIFSGIGNAYSDEILLEAGLSPFKQTHGLDEADARRLFDAVRSTLTRWTDELRDEVADGFPDKVTAFRPGMAVHGRYGKPCPRCGSPVQRIVYAENEANYCAQCQTGGRVLADRSLSRLLKANWPKRLEDIE